MHGIDVTADDFMFHVAKETMRWHVDLADFEKQTVPLIMLDTPNDSIRHISYGHISYGHISHGILVIAPNDSIRHIGYGY